MNNVSILRICGSCKKQFDSSMELFEHIRKKHDRIDVIIEIRELTAKLQHCKDNMLEYNIIEEEWSNKLNKLWTLFHDKTWL